jgi:hypothetical protein
MWHPTRRDRIHPLATAGRRRALALGAAGTAVLAVPLLGGCASVLPMVETPPGPADRDAKALFDEACEAHGLTALRGLRDFNIAYDGEWLGIIHRIQPIIVDIGYRKTSDERWLLRSGVVAQRHEGPQGTKQVVRELPRGVFGGQAEGFGTSRVRYGAAETRDREVVAASALVVDAYGLFLLGPMWLAGRADLSMRRAGIERVDGRDCEILEVWLKPGIGFAPLDRLALAVDRRDRTMRRVTLTLDSMDSTRGAVVETDTFDHLRRDGVLWPTRFYERIRRPFPNLPAHEWRVTGLDVNRGYDAAAIRGAAFAGPAASPTRPLAA